jgi:hypothetical protein
MFLLMAAEATPAFVEPHVAIVDNLIRHHEHEREPRSPQASAEQLQWLVFLKCLRGQLAGSRCRDNAHEAVGVDEACTVFTDAGTAPPVPRRLPLPFDRASAGLSLLLFDSQVHVFPSNFFHRVPSLPFFRLVLLSLPSALPSPSCLHHSAHLPSSKMLALPQRHE